VNKNTNQAEDEISRIFNDADVVTAAIQAGINAALLRHKQLGKPICVWRDGKVVWIEPENIKVNIKNEK
jgi:hypothetical protein